MALIGAGKYLELRKREKAGDTSVFDDFVHCTECKIPLQESQTGCREMGDGTYRCSDCYFDAMEDLEDHPILPPRIRRRA